MNTKTKNYVYNNGPKSLLYTKKMRGELNKALEGVHNHKKFCRENEIPHHMLVNARFGLVKHVTPTIIKLMSLLKVDLDALLENEKA